MSAITRRGVLGGLTTAATLLPLAPGLGSLAFASQAATAAPILVVVHLRGACDGLNLICPANDPQLIAARPIELRVADSGANAGLPLSNGPGNGIDWRLHPDAAPLAELYRAGHLAVVHAAGIPDANRSHFVATDIIDYGVARATDLSGASTGWASRCLTARHNNQLFAAVSADSQLAGEYHGDPAALTIPDLGRGLALPAGGAGATAIASLYHDPASAGADAAHYALAAAAEISSKQPVPADGKPAPLPAAYQPAGDFGRGLATVAGLIKLDIGLTFASINIGNWDTHENQPGRFRDNTRRLGLDLAAFWNELAAYHDRVTVLAYGEFGRRLRSNRSSGTDHGRGGAMLALGGHITGGRIHGPWPGLADEALAERVDLAVATDYRRVLSEILAPDPAHPLDASVFPGYTYPGPLGLVTL